MTVARLLLLSFVVLVLGTGFGERGAPGPGRLLGVSAAWAQGNPPPVADAGDDLTVAVGETVVLDGTGTRDPKERKLQSFTWTVVSIPAGSLAALDDASLVKPTFVADLPGAYLFELVVAQGNRASAPDQVTVSTVNSPRWLGRGATAPSPWGRP